jgi:hypothetical protein
MGTKGELRNLTSSRSDLSGPGFFHQVDLNGGNANYCCRTTPWYPMAGQAELLPVAIYMSPFVGHGLNRSRGNRLRMS